MNRNDLRPVVGYTKPRSWREAVLWFFLGKILHAFASRILSRMHECNEIGNDTLHYWTGFLGRTLRRPGWRKL